MSTDRTDTPDRKPTSGGARLRAAGRRPVNLGLTPEEYDLVRRAADADRRPMTQVLILGGLALARKILAKKS